MRLILPSVRFWREKKNREGVQQYIDINNLQLCTIIMKTDAKIIPSYKRVAVSRSRPFKLGYVPLDISRMMYLSKWCKNSTKKKFIFSRHFSLVLNSFKACICKILRCSPLLWLCRYVNAVPASFQFYDFLAVYVKWAEGLRQSYFSFVSCILIVLEAQQDFSWKVVQL